MSSRPAGGSDGAARSPAKAILSVGGIAGAIAAILALVFLVFPALKPAPPPPQLGGQISSITFSGTNSSTYAAVFTVKVQLNGFKGKPCPLLVSLQNQNSWIYTDQVLGDYTAEADQDTAATEWQIPIPRVSGQYRVWFILRDPSGTELDRQQSETLTVP